MYLLYSQSTSSNPTRLHTPCEATSTSQLDADYPTSGLDTVFQQMPGTVRRFDIVVLPPKGSGGVWEAQRQYYGDVYWYLFDRLCVNLAKLACRDIPQVGFWGLGCVEPKCVGMAAHTDTAMEEKQVQTKVAERIRLELSNLGAIGAVRFGSINDWKEQSGWQEVLEGEELDEPGAAKPVLSEPAECAPDLLAAWNGWYML